MSNQNILRSAAGLTLSGIIAKTVDFLFRAYYSGKLGSEGMGLFSLVFSFHGLILTVATGGLGVAVSKTVSAQYSQNQPGSIRKTMTAALLSVSVLSIPLIAFSCGFSKQISELFLKEPRTQISIVLLSPSILFMSISNCIKGYFYASRKVLIPASSEFLEQAVKILTITALLDRWLPRGITHGCEAVFLGLSVGEFSSCLYLSLFYAKESRYLRGFSCQERVLPSLLRIAVPALTTSLTGSYLRMQEDVLIVSTLRNSGLTHTAALSQYGMLKGMVMPLIIFPLTLMSSCFTLLIPEISRAQGMKAKLRLQTLIARIYRFTAFGGFLVCTVFVAFPEELSLWVYGAPEISSSVRLIALLVPTMFMDSVSCGILNGMGKQTSLLIFSLSDSLLRLGMIYFLVPKAGINALFFTIFTSNLFTAYHTFSTAVRSAKMSFRLSGWLLRHLLSSLATLASLWSFSAFLPQTSFSAAVTAMLFTVFLYLLWGSCFYKTMRSDISWLMHRMLV